MSSSATLRDFQILTSYICPLNSESGTEEENPMLKFPEVGVAKLLPLALCSVMLPMMKLRLDPSIETAM